MKINRKSIAVKLSLVMVAVIVLQATILIGSVVTSGVVGSLQNNAYSALNEKVSNRKNYLQNEMNLRFSNITGYAHDIATAYDRMIGEQGFNGDEKTDFFLTCVAPELLTMLRATMSTGSFIILDDNKTENSAHSGVYFKDFDPVLNNEANKDLSMLKGPVSVSRSLMLPLGKSWSYGITLSEKQKDIFNKPYLAASESGTLSHFGYWNVSPSITGDDISVLTYSLPLISKNGTAFGVIGVEISRDYLYKMLPAPELSEDGSLGYFIGKYDEKEEKIIPVINKGTGQNRVIPVNQPIKLQLANEEFGCHYMEVLNNPNPILCNVQELKIYNDHTAFEDERWLLVGMVQEEAILGFSWRFIRTLILAFTASVFIAVLVVLFAARRFVNPVITLAQKVRRNDLTAVTSQGLTGLSEIDELSSAIVELNQNVIEMSLKTDKIIQMVDLPLGTFEYKKEMDFVTCSPRLLTILNFSEEQAPNNTVRQTLFFERLSEITKQVEDRENSIYMLSANPATWVKVVMIEDQSNVLGVVMDVTQEVLENNAIKFERDYDALTKIYSRIAFKRETEKLIVSGVKEVAALVMFDLDNLKYINDAFGHDMGDLYITLSAQMLANSMGKNAVVGRMSGDEFFAFLYGFKSKAAVRKLIGQMYENFDQNKLLLPNGEQFKVRMSGGIAWYGKDSLLLDELIKYADFAMYQGKHSVKGAVREFDREVYDREFFLLSGREEMNKILDQQLLEFAFQPIVWAKTGEIYAYESLMRPQSEMFTTPLKLIQIAKAQSNLWKVEKLAFFKTLATYSKYSHLFHDCKIFINSVPNEKLKDEEYEELERTYPSILKNVVLEIIENEKLDQEILDFKRTLMNRWGGALALDDYGSGYNGDISLFQIQPQIVKIDRLLIENIENDRNRQSVVQKLLRYGKEQGVLVLAEGIETKEQLEQVVSMGVDLLQGFYIGHPEFVPDFNQKKIAAEVKKIQAKNKS